MEDKKGNSYIFLDIDGVLVSANCYYNMENLFAKNEASVCILGWVNDNLVKKLHRLIDQSGAKVVGVSSWFACLDEIPDGLKQIEEMLNIKIHDITEMSGGIYRGLAVLKWLKENNFNEDEDRFVVLDDAKKTCYGYPTLEVNGECGLTDKNVEEALLFLGKKQNINHYMELQMAAIKNDK